MEGYGNGVRNGNIVEYGRVKYIEPNNFKSDGFSDDAIKNMVYNPEDYGMFVDLVVEYADRFNPESKNLTLSWNGTSTSIMSGKNFGRRNFLSTNVLNTTFSDIQKGYNAEDFGISSIDISYTSYYVPEVVIKFTDVRGVSLLSPADYYNSPGDMTGVSGEDKDKLYYLKSFVSTFFRFPYPRYLLRVKGFYGDPVTYTLCVTDFRTSFNSSTGNFDITVRFIGYLFGILTDIPMRMLIAAPFDKYFGRKHWAERTASKDDAVPDFAYDNGTPMMTFVEFESKVEKINELSAEEQDVVKANEELASYKKEQEYLLAIKNAYETYVNNYKTIAGYSFRHTVDVNRTADGNLIDEKADSDLWDILIFPQNIVWVDKNSNNYMLNAMQGSDQKYKLADNCFDDELLRGEVSEAVKAYCSEYSVSAPEWKIFDKPLEYGVVCGLDNTALYYTPKIYESSFNYIKDKKQYTFNSNNAKFFSSISSYNGIILNKYKDQREDSAYARLNWELLNTINEEINTLVKDGGDKYTTGYLPGSTSIAFNTTPAFSAVLIHYSELEKIWKERLKTLESFIDNANSKVNEIKKKTLYENLGFEPTVKNIMNMALAHLDTFASGVYNCMKKIYADKTRTLSRYGLNIRNTDVKANNTNAFLPPFFGYYVDTKPSADEEKKKVETWIGENPRLAHLEECSYVNGFLSGSLDITNKEDDWKRAIEIQLSGRSGRPVTEDDLPALIYDYVSGKQKPYYDVFNSGQGDKMENLISYFGLRLALATLSFCDMKEDDRRKSAFEWFVEQEALRFVSSPGYESLNENEVKRLSGITKEFFSDYVSSNDTNKAYKSGELSNPIFAIEKENATIKYGKKDSYQVIPTYFTNIDDAKTKCSDILRHSHSENKDKDVLYNDGSFQTFSGLEIIEDASRFETDAQVIIEGLDSYENIGKKQFGYFPSSVYLWKQYFGLSSFVGLNGTAPGHRWIISKKNIPTDSDGKQYVIKNVDFKNYPEFLKERKVYDGKACHADSGKCEIVESMLSDDEQSFVLNFKVSESSLFADPFYYSQETGFGDNISYEEKNRIILRRKGFLFLTSLGINIHNVLAVLLVGPAKNNYNPMTPKVATLPKGAVLLLGGLIWRLTYGNVNKLVNEGSFMNDFFGKIREYFGDSCLSRFSEGKIDPFKPFVDAFTYWAENEFPYLKDQFEIKIDSIDGYSDINNYSEHNVPAVYAKVGKNKKNVYLMNNPRSGNPVFGAVSNLIFKKWVVKIPYPSIYTVSLNPTQEDGFSYNIYNYTKPLSGVTLSTAELTTAWDKFRNAVVSQKKADEEERAEKLIEQDSVKDSMLSKEFKLETYRLVKNLIDKWFIATDEKNFQFKKSDESKPGRLSSSMVYINSYYERIGNSMMVNTETLAKEIRERLRNVKESYSFYNFMATLAQSNGMMLLALPMFNDWNNKDTFETIFTPKPFSETIGKGIKGAENTYVFLYSEETSKNANIGPVGGNDNTAYRYSDDTFMFVEEHNGRLEQGKNIPNSFTLTDNDTIAAFGVTFAKGNQSFFKDIRVSMESPKTTEQVIAQTLNIADMYSANSNTKVMVQGQDLFKIYSTYSYQCTASMLGCPMIMPLMYFQLNNIPMFRGSYAIYNVKHSISPGNMTTTFVGQRLAQNRTPIVKDILIQKPTNNGVNSTAAPVRDRTGIYGGMRSIEEYANDGTPLPNKNIYKLISDSSGVKDIYKLMAIHAVLTNLSPGFENGVLRVRFDPYYFYQKNYSGGSIPTNVRKYCATNNNYDNKFVGCSNNSECLDIINYLNANVHDGKARQSLFYGAWFIPWYRWPQAIYKKDYTGQGFTLQDQRFIDEENESLEKQSIHFANILTYDNLTELINNNSDSWAEDFLRAYFDDKCYLYGYSGTTSGKTIEDTAKCILAKYELFKNHRVETDDIKDTFSIDYLNDNENISQHSDKKIFDVYQGISWLINNMQTKYISSSSEHIEPHCSYNGATCKDRSGYCAAFVKSALEAGGLDYFVCNASECISFFQNSDDWEEITDEVVVSDTDNNIPPDSEKVRSGDIAIFEAAPGHQYGHIQICLGTSEKLGYRVWASDFYQGNSAHWHGCGSITSKYHVFRYKYRRSFANA